MNKILEEIGVKQSNLPWNWYSDFDDIREAISYAAIALNTEDENLKAQCITTIKIKMWVVSTTLERIYFSQANTRHHFLSEEQYGNIIDCMNAIDVAQERWQAKYTSTKDSHN